MNKTFEKSTNNIKIISVNSRMIKEKREAIKRIKDMEFLYWSKSRVTKETFLAVSILFSPNVTSNPLACFSVNPFIEILL